MLSLKNFRERAKLTQEKLSEMSGIPIHTIRSYERNVRNFSKASFDTVDVLAGILDIPHQALMEIEDLSPEMGKLYDEIRMCSHDELLNRKDPLWNVCEDEKYIIRRFEIYTSWDSSIGTKGVTYKIIKRNNENAQHLEGKVFAEA